MNDIVKPSYDTPTPIKVALGFLLLTTFLCVPAFCGAIHDAAINGDLEKARTLLKDNPDLVSSKDNDGRTPLHLAARGGNKEIAELLLASKAEVNAKDYSGWTPLHLAAYKGHQDVAELLLSNKADVNAKDNDGDTPLQDAADKGFDALAELLRKHGGTPKAAKSASSSTASKTPAFRALDVGLDGFEITSQSTREEVDSSGIIVSADIINLTAIADNIEPRVNGTKIILLASGNIVNGKLETKNYGTFQIRSGGSVVMMTEESITKIRKSLQDSATKGPMWAIASAIHEAAKSGGVEKVKTLIKDNPDLVSRKDDGGDTPLHLAVFRGNRDLVELLLANHADVNAKDKRGLTPLNWASNLDEKDVAELLLAGNAEYNIADVVAIGDLDRVKALITANPELVFANLAFTGGYGTVLHVAAWHGQKDVAALLLANHADVNATNDEGVTPLHLLAEYSGNMDVAELLLARKADVNAKSAGGWTPLHRAAESGKLSVVQILLAKGAEVNAETSFDWTPLHAAANKGHKNVVELLLANHAEVNAKDHDGVTPLHLALKPLYATVNDGYPDVAEFLRQHGGHE